jgi:hypothetical protein
LTGQGEPEVIRGLRVSADYFKLLGVSPALGRDFRIEEDRPDTRFVVVISHALWQRRFNSDPQVAGKQLIRSQASRRCWLWSRLPRAASRLDGRRKWTRWSR